MTDMIQMCSLTMVGLMALGVQNKSDNFRAKKSPGSSDWCAQIDCEPEQRGLAEIASP